MLIFSESEGQQIRNNAITSNFSEGISNLSVTTILEDSYGFIWVGTRDGLCRFDGNEFKNYYTSQSNKSALSNSYILFLFEDSGSNIWIGTLGGGLNVYDRQKDNFRQFHSKDPTTQIPQNNHFIIEDNKGDIWTATNNGVFVIDPAKDDIVKHYLEGEMVGELFKDATGNIWAAGFELFFFDFEKDKMYDTRDDQKFESELTDDIIYEISQDENGRMWLISRQKGLLELIQYQSGKFDFHPKELKREKSLESMGNLLSMLIDGNTIYLGTENDGLYCYMIDKSKTVYKVKGSSDVTYWSIIKDSQGRIWLGTYGRGLDVIDPYSQKFEHFKIIDNNKEAVVIEGIHIDEEDHISIATGGSGLLSMTKGFEEVRWYRSDTPNGVLSSNYLTSIYQDDLRNLYLTSWDGGITILDEEKKHLAILKSDEKLRSSLSENEIMALAFDPVLKEILWIGTWYGGIDRFNQKTGIFENISADKSDEIHISDENITDLLFDSKGNLWLATSFGLNKISFDENRVIKNVKEYNHSADSTSLSGDYLSFLFLDSSKQLWIGTHSEGLNRYDEEKDRFIRYTQPQHKFNAVVSMEEDEEHNFWVSSAGGISKLSLKNGPGDWQNYDKSNGLESDFFKLGASAKFSDGRMVFGGKNGLDVFMPNEIKTNFFGPKPYLKQFEIFHRPIDFNDSTQNVLTKSIQTTQEILLGYDQNHFSIEFNAIGFTNPEHNSFAYKLKGVDPDWIHAGMETHANYTSVPPGKYEFKVKAANSDGVWSEQARTLRIVVHPAWWGTIWFKIIVVLIVVLVLYNILTARERRFKKNQVRLEMIVKERTQKISSQQKTIEERAVDLEQKNHHISMQHEELQSYVEALNELNNKLEKRVNERTLELINKNNKLSDFAFINSHELRKPLSNILGIIELFDLELDQEDFQNFLERLKHQAHRLDEQVHKMQNKLQKEHDEEAKIVDPK